MRTTRSAAGRRWPWLIAAGTLAVAGITGLSVRAAVAEPSLPPLTPAELLTRVAQAHPAGLSGTFEQRSDLGLPSLSGLSGGEGDDLTTAVSMLTGTHTVRVWLAGEDQTRVALVDGQAETAAIRNGADLWLWSSEKQQARHATIPAGEHPATTPMAPTEAVRRLLTALTPSTEVTTTRNGTIAGRPVYQLVLTPKDADSLVAHVQVSVDATEFVPLAAQVVADDGSQAISVAATSVDFSRPADSTFAFTPPPGVKVGELKTPPSLPSGKSSIDAGKDHSGVSLVGSGWTTVAVAKFDVPKSQANVAALLKSLPQVSGTWGKGRLVSTTLVNAVITDDGRIAVGSVAPEKLYAALARK